MIQIENEERERKENPILYEHTKIVDYLGQESLTIHLIIE